MILCCERLAFQLQDLITFQMNISSSYFDFAHTAASVVCSPCGRHQAAGTKTQSSNISRQCFPAVTEPAPAWTVPHSLRFLEPVQTGTGSQPGTCLFSPSVGCWSKQCAQAEQPSHHLNVCKVTDIQARKWPWVSCDCSVQFSRINQISVLTHTHHYLKHRLNLH